MTPEQINEFKVKAKSLGKTDAQINAFIQQKQTELFSPRPQTEMFSPRPQPVEKPPEPQGFWGKLKAGVSDGLKDFGNTVVGGLKGAASTINGASALGQKGLNSINGLITGKKEPIASLPKNLTTPTEAQKPGFVGEQIAEFFIPGGAVNKLSKAVDIAADGAKIGKLGTAALKIGGKALVQGGATAAIGSAQSSSLKQGLKSGAVVGGISAGAGVVGEVLKAARIPEWFYSKIYRTSADDMLQELKSIGTANLQKTNPELFKKLVSSGVIKLDQAGRPLLNETLAKEALDRGLKGSIKHMSSEVVKNTYQLEDTAQRITDSHLVPIKIEPQYVKVLKGVVKDYQDVGFGEIRQRAEDLVGKISNGHTDASTALELRRFLDGMRTRFNPNATLSQTQQNFKTLADTLRGRLATEVPGLKPVMNEYRFNIEALDALAKEAAKRGNREVISLIDSVFFGSGVATGNPALGAGLGVFRRAINSPSGNTGIGQALNNIGKGASFKGKLLKAGAGYVTANRGNP